MELKVKVKVNNASEINKILSLLRNLEKEYSCKCTELDVEVIN